jgi:sugar O-acyltransferase (sialic acid O-acetyltransferase NeuD family)
MKKSMKKKLIIFGNTQQAELATFFFEKDSDYEIVAYTADHEYLSADTFLGKPNIPFEKISSLYDQKNHDMFIAIGYSKMNSIREQKYFEAKKKGYPLASYISSKCTLLTDYPLGDNCFILEDNTIQPFVKIGNNVTLWSGNHIGHHSVIEDHNFISSHVVISGNCIIKKSCFIGVNATIHNDVLMEEKNLIAAGAIITSSTQPKQVYLPPKSSVFKKSSDQLNF